MPADALRVLSLDAAGGLFETLAGDARPATLHPRYVAADAQRNAGLTPAFTCYESQGERWLHGLHTTTIAGTPWKDASSPYGYGGPCSSSSDEGFLRQAWTAYDDWARAQGIVVEYLRFHPLLQNERGYGGTVAPNREVVSVDLSVPDLMANYAVRLKQTLRKAGTAGLRYSELPFAEAARDFAAFHRAAMQAMATDAFFIFGDAYFDAIASAGFARLGLCTDAQGEWRAAGLFLDGQGVREYHLAATTEAGRKLGASSVVLHGAAESARASGLRQLYLGGGTSASEDNPLLFFKSSFSPLRLAYCTGAHIHDTRAHDELKHLFPQHWAAHPGRPIFHRLV